MQNSKSHKKGMAYSMSKRKLALILCLAMAASLISACADTEPSGTITDGGSETSEAVDQSSNLLNDGLDGLDFNQTEVGIFCTDYSSGYSDTYQYFYVDETNGEIVNDAVYNRNRTIEERLNVKLNYTRYPFTYGEKDKMYTTVRSGVMSDSGGMDIICVPPYFVSTFIVEGLLEDMSSLPHIDFSKPWWSSDFIETATINNKTYLAAGDGTLTYLAGIFCLAYNKNLAQDFGIDDIYDTVFDGKWTLDCMEQILKGIYSDLNGNSEADKDDRYGFELFGGNDISSFLTSCEGYCVSKEGNEYKYTFDSERVVDLYDRIYSLIHVGNEVIFENNDNLSIAESVFGQGRALFGSVMFQRAESMRDLSFEFGVLPYPKFDEAQENYHCRASAGMAAFIVPVSCSDREATGAVLEALSSEGYKTLTPAYYEVAMKVKYTNGERTSEMLDLIRDSASIDFATMFASSLGGPTDLFKNTVSKSANSGVWTSTTASQKKNTEQLLDDLITAINQNT